SVPMPPPPNGAAFSEAYHGGVNDGFFMAFDAQDQRYWGSYYGVAAKEDAMVVRSDGNGNLCLAGNTTSANIPLVNAGGSYQSAYQGGSDCFLAYIKREGVRRWATYLGGQGDDMIANEGVELRSSTV